MARFTFRLPDIGEGIAEAEIVAWHVRVGDTVAEDGRLADMMTDKATVEMESPVAGRVVELAGEVGDMVPIGAALAVIETAEAEVEAPAAAVVKERIAAETPEPEGVATVLQTDASARPSTGSGGSGESQAAAKAPAPPPVPLSAEQVAASAPPSGSKPKVLASPAVRARAKKLGIDLADLRPAADGRIRHADLDAFVSYGSAGGYAPAGTTRADEQIRVVGLRRRIADKMAASKRQIPHFSYVEECDVTDLEAMRVQLNTAAEQDAKSKLTLLPFLIVAICRVVPRYPMINARYDDEAGVVTRHGAVHLGVATQTEAGLMVPVIRDAQNLNLWQLARTITDLAGAARDGTIRGEELSGSTLTVTSLGRLGGIASTPVINRPEVAIIAPNRIVERPMLVSDGLGGERLAKRKMMNLSISCDHRVVDGWDAANFVQALRRLLENPALLLADPG